MAFEDTSFDLVTNHGFEIVDWMASSAEGAIHAAAEIALPAPVALSAPSAATQVAATGMAIATAVAVRVELGSSFLNPVVVASRTSAVGVGAAAARITDATATGFYLAVQETGDQDGARGAEDVSWIVAEVGSWVLGDAGGAALALEHEEAPSRTAHASESAGWIAVDRGAAVDPDGFAPEVGVSSASHLGAQAALSGQWGLASAPWREPAALSDRMRSRRGWRYLLDAGFGARLEGDMSRNAEIGYSTEDLRWSAFDGAQEIWRDAPV